VQQVPVLTKEKVKEKKVPGLQAKRVGNERR